MRALVLDFDGVVIDSAPEGYLVSRRTYAEMGPAVPTTHRLPGRVPGLERSLDEIRADPTFHAFEELMPLGNRAEDYAVAWSTIERGVTLADQAAYDAERAKPSADFLDAYHERFYEVRAALQAEDPQRWRALQAPYVEFTSMLRRRAEDVELAIATAKDRASVRLLLEEHGLSALFPDERLMDKETGRSKTAHLRHLRERLGIPFPEMTFVEDKVNHLDAVAPLGVRCALATWGYNGPREHALAEERGYLVCTLANAEEQLFGG